MSYKEPDWAVEPSNPNDWKLIEIKNGVEVGQHKLNKSTIIFGRAVDMVHIPIGHESASRQHARIAFDSQGLPWLKDLQSTHGTKVNKRPLPSVAISKVETNSTTTGSRGIMLFPGDIIQFGASTRFYTLDGPSEFERGAIQAKLAQQKLAKQQQQSQQSSSQQHTNNTSSTSLEPGASSWGISMDEDDDEYDDEDDRDHHQTKSIPDNIQIPEKYQKMYEKLNGMKYKLTNLETEDTRIRRKGGSELTEGQTKQLQRNTEREETLRKSIIELEETLYDKLYPDNNIKNSKKSSRQHATHDDDDDEDDFFDRTKSNNDNDNNKNNDPNHTTNDDDIGVEAESEQSLVSKWKKYFDEQSKMKGSILDQAEDRVVALQERLFKLQSTGDEDAFFVENDLKLAKETKDKIVTSIETTLSKMKEVEKVLKIVNPKVHCDWATGYIGQGPPPPPSVQEAEKEKEEEDDEGETQLE